MSFSWRFRPVRAATAQQGSDINHEDSIPEQLSKMHKHTRCYACKALRVPQPTQRNRHLRVTHDISVELSLILWLRLWAADLSILRNQKCELT